MKQRRRTALVAGALGAALAIGGGAFGAHGLASRLDPRGLELWETAVRYLMYGSAGLLVVGLVPRQGSSLAAAGVSLGAGTLVFSATVAALALGGPGWLGAVTPLGGLGMIAGFLLLAWHSWRGADS